MLSQASNNLIINEVDLPLDPKFVWKKYGVEDPLNNPDSWRYIAKEVKDIMTMMTGYQPSMDGFKEIIKFEEAECKKN